MLEQNFLEFQLQCKPLSKQPRTVLQTDFIQENLKADLASELRKAGEDSRGGGKRPVPGSELATSLCRFK